LEKDIREGGHGGADLFDKGTDHTLVEVVGEHLLLEGGETRKGDLIQTSDLLFNVHLLPGITSTEFTL
jgi:hypothetical protein